MTNKGGQEQWAKRNIDMNNYIVKEMHTGCGVKLSLRYQRSRPFVIQKEEIQLFK